MSTPDAQPTLETARLVLRPFRPSDAADIQSLAGERDIADTTMNIPHPYADGMAEEWIAGHESAFAGGASATFAMVPRDAGSLVGTIGLRIDSRFNLAELGYWVGKPFWGRGYATEAATAVLAFGFDELQLNRIQASHLVRNPASGRVMQKAGMVHEGTARQSVMKWGEYEDLELYSMLRDDWVDR